MKLRYSTCTTYNSLHTFIVGLLKLNGTNMAYRRLRSTKGYHWPGKWDKQGWDFFFLKLHFYSVHFLDLKCPFLFFFLYPHLKNSLSLISSTYPTLITISLIDLHLLQTPLYHMFFKYSWNAFLGEQDV